MALSAGTARKQRSLEQDLKGYGTVATATTIYPGALVAQREADSLLIPADTATTGAVFVGVSVSKTSTAGATVEFHHGHVEKLTADSALTAAYRMCRVVALDDDSVATETAVSAAKRKFVGYAVDFASDGDAWVLVDPTSGQKTAP